MVKKKARGKTPTAVELAATKAGITQVELARRVGVDRGVIGRIWRGQQQPTPEQATWIAQALDTEVENLFPDAESRGFAAAGERESELAKRILGLEACAAQLLAENQALKEQRQEVIDQFSAKLSEVHADLIDARRTVDEKNMAAAAAEEACNALRFQLWQSQLQARQRENALQQQIRALQQQVESLKGVAAASGGAAILTALGALAVFSDR